jgi:membrane associated rhomboid family serine protease
MIPVQDSPGQERRHLPLVTLLLIAVNVVVFVYELTLGSALPGFVQAYGLVPLEITTGRPLTAAAPSFVYLTLITSMFIHAGFLHIGGNMLFLWIFGDNVEDSLGHFLYLGFYFLCGIVAGLAQVAVSPLSTVPAIGASGAIAGVLAGYLLLFPHAVVRALLLIGPFVTFSRLSALLMIGVWILFQVASGVVDLAGNGGTGAGVAFWAHIGGFAMGLAATGLWRLITRRQTRAPEP